MKETRPTSPLPVFIRQDLYAAQTPYFDRPANISANGHAKVAEEDKPNKSAGKQWKTDKDGAIACYLKTNYNSGSPFFTVFSGYYSN